MQQYIEELKRIASVVGSINNIAAKTSYTNLVAMIAEIELSMDCNNCVHEEESVDVEQAVYWCSKCVHDNGAEDNFEYKGDKC